MLIISVANMLEPAGMRAARRLWAACIAFACTWIAAVAAARAGLFVEAEAAESLPPFY
jgi:hypothetical protein